MIQKTRFAPSPTGYLHIGGVRTALFSWLHARKHGAPFVLRIEDTDRERSTEASVNAILEGMTWLGLDYDEGPFYQTHRFDRYKEITDKLLNDGHAYHCYCSKEELDVMREAQMENKEKPRYDGRCRARTQPVAGVNPVVRFKNPSEGVVIVNDFIRGRVIFQNTELDDLIIVRSDGTPTYNLTVVVDDMDMEVNCVIRGDDHLNNTPRQINILKALGVDAPSYAHVPMILGADGKRLSKRHGAVSVIQYREDGYLPEAVLNYLVRLGWAHGDQEVFSLDEMITLFDINHVNKSASTFNPDKLLWLNQQYVAKSDPAHIVHHLSYHLGKLNIDPSDGPDIIEVVKIHQDRAKTLLELAAACRYFYHDFEAFDEKAAKKNLKLAAKEPLEQLRDKLAAYDDWHPELIHQAILEIAETLELKMGKVAQPLRVAVTGGAVSPAIDVTVHLIGKSRTLARLDRALDYIGNE